MNDEHETLIDREELFGWIEFGCWTALVLTPLLYWINGPAVSLDQLVVRWSVVLGVSVGAITLRRRAWRRRI